MNRFARKGLVSALVTGGVLASAGYAQADAATEGDAAGSPGVLSGNSVQVPVHVPVNVCGNTVDVVGLLNPVVGNVCANRSSGSGTTTDHDRRAHRDRRADADGQSGPRASGDRPGGGAHAVGDTRDSAGVLAGNGLQLPLDLPLNVSGNTADVVGIGNPSFGNTAVNDEAPPAPPADDPNPAPPSSTPGPVAVSESASAAPTLAHTGAGGVGTAAAGGLALLAGGTVIYRRARTAARR